MAPSDKITRAAPSRLGLITAYARALRDFIDFKSPELHRSSFDRVAASDWSDLPPAQHFDVAGGHLGFRHYTAAGSAQALVLIHGSGCFGDLMHEMALRICRRNAAHVYTLDMRGHGLSSGKRGHAVTVPNQLIGDIAAFLEHLRATLGHSYITLGGHSAGGGLVLAFARSSEQQLASSYLFLAPFLGLGSKVNRPHFGGWVRLELLKFQLLTLANLFGITRFNEATVVGFNVGAARDPRYVANWSFNTLLQYGPGPWLEDLPLLSREKPVLVLAAAADECFVQPLYKEAFQVIAPHAQLPDVGLGGHWDLLVDPIAIQLITAWLADQSTSRGREVPAAYPDRAA